MCAWLYIRTSLIVIQILSTPVVSGRLRGRRAGTRRFDQTLPGRFRNPAKSLLDRALLIKGIEAAPMIVSRK